MKWNLEPKESSVKKLKQSSGCCLLGSSSKHTFRKLIVDDISKLIKIFMHFTNTFCSTAQKINKISRGITVSYRLFNHDPCRVVECLRVSLCWWHEVLNFLHWNNMNKVQWLVYWVTGWMFWYLQTGIDVVMRQTYLCSLFPEPDLSSCQSTDRWWWEWQCTTGRHRHLSNTHTDISNQTPV